MNDMTKSKVLQAAAGLYRNHATGQNKHTASGNATEDDIRYFNEQADRLESISTYLEAATDIVERIAKADIASGPAWQIRLDAQALLAARQTGKARHE